MRSMIDRRGIKRKEIMGRWNQVVSKLKKEGSISVAEAAFLMGYMNLNHFKYNLLPILLEFSPCVTLSYNVLRYDCEEVGEE